jgi:nitrogen fixation NifU-like protein
MTMDDLYGEIILDHARSPHHAGLRDPFDAETHQVNPTCGDEVTLRVNLADEKGGDGPVVTDVSYDALGCSISQAATSMLTDLVTGRPLTEAHSVLAAFEAMVTSKGEDAGDEDVLGDAVAFAGVAKYPNRVKCALLGWKAFKLAAAQAAAGHDTAATGSGAAQGE